ncbi:MAG: peptidoglycan DD-metalloendopeptidase family protein [bacterium]
MQKRATARLAMGILLIALLSTLLPLGAVQAQDGSTGKPYTSPRWPLVDVGIEYEGPSSYDFFKKHTGFDAKGIYGDPVYSVCTGTVIYWGDWPWEGTGSLMNTIWLDCGNGDYYGFSHLAEDLDHSQVNDHVDQGQVIGYIGEIGEDKSGYGSSDHLHFSKTKTGLDPRTIKSLPEWAWEDPMLKIDVTVDPRTVQAQPIGESLSISISAQSRDSIYQENIRRFYAGVTAGKNLEKLLTMDTQNFEGSWLLPSGTTLSLNQEFGWAKYEEDQGMGVPSGMKIGDGNCNAASAVRAALIKAGIEAKADDPTHSAVAGVPSDMVATVCIGTPAYPCAKDKDVWVTNRLGYDTRLNWKVEGDSLTLWVTKASVDQLGQQSQSPEISPDLVDKYPELKPFIDEGLKIWEEIRRWAYGNGEEVTIIVTDDPNPSPQLNLDPKTILIGIGALVLMVLIFFWFNPGKAGTTMLWVSNTAPTMVNTWKYVFKEAFRWWFAIIALSVVATPPLRAMFVHGFVNWLNGSTTYSNKMQFVVVVAVVVNLILQKWFMAKTIRTQEGYVMEVPTEKTGCLWSLVKFVISANLILILILTVSGVNLIEAFSPPITTTPVLDSKVIGQGLPPSVQYWAPDIARWSAQYGQNGTEDPLVGAVIMTFESCGRPSAGSSAGAQGLFQVMTSHWPASEQTSSAMQDPDRNAEKGYAWLNTCFKLYWPNDPERAFGCYNSGSGGVSGPKSSWPAETQRYVALTVPAYNELKASNGISSPTILDWRSPGDSFCRQATTVLSQPPWNDRPIP